VKDVDEVEEPHEGMSCFANTASLEAVDTPRSTGGLAEPDRPLAGVKAERGHLQCSWEEHPWRHGRAASRGKALERMKAHESIGRRLRLNRRCWRNGLGPGSKALKSNSR
jgi:hypothetical protein